MHGHAKKGWQRFEVTMFEPNPVSGMAIFGKREEGFQKFVAFRSLFEGPATADHKRNNNGVLAVDQSATCFTGLQTAFTW